MTEIRAVALDPGQVFGAAWSTDHLANPEHSVAWHLEGHADQGARYVALWDRLKALPLGGRPTHVFYEETPQKGMKHAQWFGGYRATVQTWSAYQGAAFVDVGAGAVRLWATGRGAVAPATKKSNPNAEKDRMREAALKALQHGDYRMRADTGLKPIDLTDVDHNRIDALWLLAWGLDQVLGPWDGRG